MPCHRAAGAAGGRRPRAGGLWGGRRSRRRWAAALEDPSLAPDGPDLEAEGGDVAAQPVEVDPEGVGAGVAAQASPRPAESCSATTPSAARQQSPDQPLVDGRQLDPRPAKHQPAVEVDTGAESWSARWRSPLSRARTSRSSPGNRTQSWRTSPASGGSAAGATNRRRGTRCSARRGISSRCSGQCTTTTSVTSALGRLTCRPAGDPSDGFVPELAGADPHQPVEVDGPDLAVTDLPGAGRLGDQVDDLVGLAGVDEDLDLDLGHELRLVLRPTEHLGLAALGVRILGPH